MTDPTPTRAEVERLGLRYNAADDCDEIASRADGPYVRFSDYEALRERAEAAERDRDEALNQLDSAKRSVDVLCRRITNTNAAWNDAIEAAAEAKGYEHLAERAAIRALRRAAPTEGEA